jgi:2-polyprenyl-3-methyl-5-hydroxy-6-metoxy-1,4-benzoquinol methylase
VKASIVIPAYNEENRIYDCLSQLTLSIPEDSEIIVSADGCTDRTVEIAKLFPVKIVTFHERLGKGGGILNAIRSAEGEAIVITDVDLSVSPSEISNLVNALRDSDIVLGSRNLEDSMIKIKPPFHRIFLGRAFNWLFRKLFNIQVFDTQCGFKAVRREVIQDLSNDLNVDGFAFDANLVVKAHKKGFRIVEVPIVWSYKKGSRVNSLYQMYAMGRDLLMVWLETKKREVETRDLKDFYDAIPGDVYEKACKSWFLPRRLWHAYKNREVIKKVEGKWVLDVGCGSGTIVKTLLKKGKKVVGVDIGKKFLNFCHSMYGNAAFCGADAQYLPFPDCCFDTIVCSEVIEHLNKPEKILKEFERTLRPNGELVITTPNVSVRWAFLEAVWTRIRRKMLETNHKCLTRKRLRFLLDSTGFSIFHDASFMCGCLLIVKARKKNLMAGNIKSVRKSEEYLDLLTEEACQESTEEISIF